MCRKESHIEKAGEFRIRVPDFKTAIKDGHVHGLNVYLSIKEQLSIGIIYMENTQLVTASCISSSGEQCLWIGYEVCRQVAVAESAIREYNMNSPVNPENRSEQDFIQLLPFRNHMYAMAI